MIGVDEAPRMLDELFAAWVRELHLTVDWPATPPPPARCTKAARRRLRVLALAGRLGLAHRAHACGGCCGRAACGALATT